MGIFVSAALALTVFAFGMPKEARAFWPFPPLTPTAEAGSDPVISDSSLALLEAATNADPNPDKGQRDIALTGGAALMGSAGPDGTPPDIDAPQGTGNISLYVVRTGDTLSEIADMFGVSSNTILWANDLGSAKDIHPGQSLLILPISGVKHTVKQGETLAGIAKAFGGDAAEVASYNGFDAEAPLVVGSVIIIPGGEIAPTQSSTKAVAVTSSVKTGGTALSLPRGSGPSYPGYYQNPLPGAILTQGLHPTNAVDIGASCGTPIHAAAAGTVIVSRTTGWNGGYAEYVVLKHSNGSETLYAHQSRVVASLGQTVAKGQIIGYVGRTGNATGCHLHFEVRGAANPLAACTVGRACNL